jgi:hypothetical protein
MQFVHFEIELPTFWCKFLWYEISRLAQNEKGLKMDSSFVQRYDFSELIDQADLVTAVSCNVIDHLIVNVALGMCMTKESAIYMLFSLCGADCQSSDI